jgi:hypothetical protein
VTFTWPDKITTSLAPLVLAALLLLPRPALSSVGVCVESEGRTRDGNAWDETAAELAQRLCDADIGWQSSVRIYSDVGDGTVIEVRTFQLALVRDPLFRQVADAYTKAVQQVLAPGRVVTFSVFPVRIGSARAIASWRRAADGTLTGGIR